MSLLLLLPIACSDGWTDEQIANAQNVARAMKLEQEAVMISNRMGPGVISREDYRLVRDKLRAAVEHAVAQVTTCLIKFTAISSPTGKRNF